MSTLESTVSMIQQLPEKDLLKVQAFVRLFFSETDNPFSPLTEEQIYSQLEESRLQASEGKVKDAWQIASDVREKYGL